ncbi:MAG: flagellar hook-length control protein FliK [Chitinivibrionales bacterium]|nr:flagellar hook-length control protein FliK [Chitinivibrionales bacterium]
MTLSYPVQGLALPALSAMPVNGKNTRLPAPIRGIVQQRIDESTYRVSSGGRTFTVVIDSPTVSAGDPVDIFLLPDKPLTGVENREAATKGGRDSISFQKSKMVEILTALVMRMVALNNHLPQSEAAHAVRNLLAVLQEYRNGSIPWKEFLRQVRANISNETVQSILAHSLSQADKNMVSYLLNVIQAADSADTALPVKSSSTETEPHVTSSSFPALARVPSCIIHAESSEAALAKFEALIATCDRNISCKNNFSPALRMHLSGPVILRYSSIGEQASLRIVAAASDYSGDELRQLIYNHKFSLIGSQNNAAAVLTELVRLRGVVTVEQLQSIERVLPQSLLTKPTLFDRTPGLWAQLWSSVLNSDGKSVQPFLSSMTEAAGSSQTLPMLIEQLHTALEALPQHQKQLENLLSPLKLSSPTADTNSLIRLFNAIGYGLEHALAGNDTIAEKCRATVKSFLLVLLDFCQTRATVAQSDKKSSDSLLTLISPPEKLQAAGLSRTSRGAGDVAPSAEAVSLLNAPVLEMIGRRAEAVLNRLELFQGLARTTQTSDGQQQVIVLPVAINQEWTELRFTFIQKDSSRKKGKRKERFHVSMDLTLSHIGSVEANLEYQVKKQLALSIVCSRESVRRWFSQQIEAIRDKLIKCGLPAVTVSVSSNVQPCQGHTTEISGDKTVPFWQEPHRCDIKV